MPRPFRLLLWFILVAFRCQPAPAEYGLEDAIAALSDLESTTLSVEYEYVELKDVLADLAVRLGTPVHGDWPTLNRLGVYDDDEISFSLSRGKASTVLAGLTIMLGDEFERPTFEYHAGRLVLTSFQATAAMRLTDSYDLRDLIRNDKVVAQLRQTLPEPYQPDPAPDQSPASGEDGSGAVHQGGDPGKPTSPTDDDDREDPDEPEWKMLDLPEVDMRDAAIPATPGEELIALITEHVDPEAWINYGGSIALISERDGLALVSAPPSLHRKLRDAITRLRRLNPTGVAIEAAIIDVPRSDIEILARRHDRSSNRYARALMRADESVLLWSAETSASIGESAEIESKAGTASIMLSVTPQLDEETGNLGLEVAARMSHEDDVRSIRTVAAIPHRNGAAILELPAARPVETVRLLVLLPRRTP